MLRFTDPPDLRWDGRKQQRGSPEPESGKVRKESTPGRAEPCGEKGEIHWRGTARSEAGEPWALRRRSRTKFACGPGQSAAQVILGIGMTAGKARTGDPEDGVDLARRHAVAQEFLSDPFVGNAPVGLGEALWNVESAQPSLIEGSRCGGGDRRVERGEEEGVGRESSHGAVGQLALGGLDQRVALSGECGLSVQ